MNVLSAVTLGVAMGAVFGIALEKSRVFEPGAIISQMQLRTFLMGQDFSHRCDHRPDRVGDA